MFIRSDRNCYAADVIVVGAGLAGSTAAVVLGQQGWRVIVIDPRSNCPPVFKAEKIEPDQAQLLLKFNLLEVLLPHAGVVREILSYYNGRLHRISRTEQFGVAYSDMVNAVRSRFPDNVQLKLGRVVNIANSANLQRVMLANGEELTARLVVLACGVCGDIPKRIGLHRTYVQKQQSYTIGFNIARPDEQPFPFDAVTYYANSQPIDFISFFKMGQSMRANLFGFPAGGLDWLRQFRQNPAQELLRCLPKLATAIGEYRIASKVETVLVDLYRTEHRPENGVVLIGDAAQNVCPATAMGLSKILTDVDVLSECVPLWLCKDGISKDTLMAYYHNNRKLQVDAKALADAFYRRQACTGTSLQWRVHRTRLHLEMQFKKVDRAVQDRYKAQVVSPVAGPI